jgi:hypothetical protein
MAEDGIVGNTTARRPAKCDFEEEEPVWEDDE